MNPFNGSAVVWLQPFRQITNPEWLSKLVSGTVQVCAVTIFSEQFKFHRRWAYITPVEPASITNLTARHLSSLTLGTARLWSPQSIEKKVQGTCLLLLLDDVFIEFIVILLQPRTSLRWDATHSSLNPVVQHHTDTDTVYTVIVVNEAFSIAVKVLRV